MLSPFYLCLTIIFIISQSNASRLKNNGVFPKKFALGAATAAYQIEGAWNEDGKGQSVWDEFSHRSPSPIANNATGDIACDSYHKWKEDVHLVTNLGMQYYRFSIAWTRLFPDGYVDKKINEAGLNYYKKLIQYVVKQGLKPAVTLFHWDLPLKLYKDGISWTNNSIIDIYVNYTREFIRHFPEVSMWITVNEPRTYCRYSYGTGILAPGIKESGISDYQCVYVILKAHAAVYRMYKKEFPHYKAPMSIVIDCQWYEPESNKIEDVQAADRQVQFECGLYYHPVFIGDWPSIVVERVAERSKKEGYKESRLPKFTEEEIAFIRGTHDYLSVNHYFTFLAANEKEAPYNHTDYDNDVRVINSRSPDWAAGSNKWAIVPWGVRKVLNWLKQQYGDNPIFITEMGVSDDGSSLNDYERINFYSDYICEILEAIQIDRVNVNALFVWSLMDNLEWNSGYDFHFGLYSINFHNDTTRKRTPKRSVSFFQRLSKTRKLHCSNYKGNWQEPSWGPFGKKHYSYESRLHRNRHFLPKLLPLVNQMSIF
nr:glycoside hydrolase family 1 [Phyllotreta armoraciae]